jgi:hypothetical protein
VAPISVDRRRGERVARLGGGVPCGNTIENEDGTLKRRSVAAAATVFACVVAAQPALADGSDPANVVPVTGTSRLPAGCGTPEGDGYVLNPNTEVVPMVARDPKRAGHLVAVYQQDRWNRYGGNGTGIALSDDNGESWRPAASRPAFAKCDGGEYEVTTDHWVTVTPSGTAVAASLSLSRSGEVTAILVSRSADGGDHWDAPVTLQRNDIPRFFNDRPAITADPYNPGVLYAVWDRVDDQSTDTESNWVQPVFMAKSTDDGRTWTTKKVYDFPANSGAIGTELVPMADGTLLIGMHPGHPVDGRRRHLVGADAERARPVRRGDQDPGPG